MILGIYIKKVTFCSRISDFDFDCLWIWLDMFILNMIVLICLESPYISENHKYILLIILEKSNFFEKNLFTTFCNWIILNMKLSLIWISLFIFIFYI